MEPLPRIPQETALVGIDVSKERLDVHARPSGATRGVAHDATGLKTLARWLGARAPELVVVEATGGLAPHPRDSGRRHRHRSIGGGRGARRAVLDMAALSAIRCNPLYRQLHQRLRGRGKPGKLALVAVMRHMPVARNAILKDHRPWQPTTCPA